MPATFLSLFSGCKQTSCVPPHVKLCIEKGQLDELQEALRAPFNPDALFALRTDSITASTIWHIAAARGDVSILKYLYNWYRSAHRDGDAEAFSIPDKQGRTPLMLSCQNKNGAECVEALLQWGASPLNERDKRGRLPIHYAAQSGGLAVLQLLLRWADNSAGAPTGDAAMQPLSEAAARQQEQALQHRRSMSCAEDACGLTPLHYAAASNDSAVCEELLGSGANLMAKSSSASYDNSMPCNAGMTPLHVAAMSNAFKAANVMLVAWARMSMSDRVRQWSGCARAGLADPRAVVDKEGKTACMVAASRRYDALAGLLDASSPLALVGQGPEGEGPGQPAITPPSMFCCPITMDLMQEPVVASDGFSYERIALEKWLKSNKTSPMTNLPLRHMAIFPNHVVKQAINEWRVQHGLPELPKESATISNPSPHRVVHSRGLVDSEHDAFLRDMSDVRMGISRNRNTRTRH